MNKLNSCCTGDTLVLTIDGPVRFDELAKKGEDVIVYCYNEQGKIVLSKMFNPRITGYKQSIVEIVLENGFTLKTTDNHELLTDLGYFSVNELYEGDNIIVEDWSIEKMSDEIDNLARLYSDITSTKKGTVIKTCEVCGKEFEVDWNEREQCSDIEHQRELYFDVLSRIKKNINTNTKDNKTEQIIKYHFLNDREDVFNGTVAKYHNYFVYDEKTNSIVNQLNCGE